MEYQRWNYDRFLADFNDFHAQQKPDFALRGRPIPSHALHEQPSNETGFYPGWASLSICHSCHCFLRIARAWKLGLYSSMHESAISCSYCLGRAWRLCICWFVCPCDNVLRCARWGSALTAFLSTRESQVLWVAFTVKFEAGWLVSVLCLAHQRSLQRAKAPMKPFISGRAGWLASTVSATSSQNNISL